MAERRDLRLVMMGTGTFAGPTLHALFDAGCNVVGLVTQPDRAMGATRGSTRQVGEGMKAIAEQHGVPVYQPESVNTPEGVEHLRAWQPDLLVVAAYGQILNNDVLATAAHGGINVHASLLPRYRGAAPIAWAIYHGEQQTGVTIIRMTTGLDAGDMLAQEATPIGAEETAGEVEARLAPLGGRMAVQVIDQIAAGATQGVKQDRSLVTKAPKLKKEHGLIDWARPAAAVCNQVRAMLPWPTPYTFLHHAGRPPLRVIINLAIEFPVRYDPAVPAGSIFTDTKFPKSLFVVAGEVTEGEERSVVEIYELQPAGKRRMTADEFLRGHPVRPGDRFGPEAP
jgi:methionyl-tRNA formyltransferase